MKEWGDNNRPEGIGLRIEFFVLLAIAFLALFAWI